MAVTPLIKPVQNKKGIFYNFQSALEDINITLANTSNAVRFSKFALLRIPEIGVPVNLPTDNKIQFYAQGETPLIDGINPDNTVNLAQSFQNYALNLETLLISRNNYKKDQPLTVSERVFFKWLKELGAIRFQDANSLEKNVTTVGTDPRFVEKVETNSTYNRVVKYIGDIDVVNTLKNNNNSYVEAYIHVPSNVGTTPYVLFKSVSDVNYYGGLTVTNTPADPLNSKYLAGRSYTDVHPFGLSLRAFYDLDDGSIYTETKTTSTGTYTANTWFNQNIDNSYYTDPVATYNHSSELYIRKTKSPDVIEYVRTNLDGISIDFDLANYKLATEDPTIKVFAQFNDYVGNRDFEFNAILVYYDTYDPHNVDSNGMPLSFTTNLYGVLFLDSVQQKGLEFQIPTIIKFKQDPLNRTNGNAFSHKMNLKLDSSVEDTLVEKSINDYSTFSLELFTDVLTQFKNLQQLYTDKLLSLEQLTQDVTAVKSLLLNTETADSLNIRLTNLETSLTANLALFNNTDAIMQLITANSDQINSLISGGTSVTVSYNLDAIKSGDGISIDRRTPNRAKIINTNQEYNITQNSITNVFSSNTLALTTFTNYFAHQNGGTPITLSRDLIIKIDDSTVAWSTGQTLRLVFDDEIIPGIYNVKFYTDAKNVQNLGVYGVLIGIATDLEFTPSGNMPIFEIICLDSRTFSFKIDKIR